MVYDGDCAFCRRWILRWNSLTKGRVEYAPFQEVAQEFPEIPREAFEKSVQLILPDGNVFSGAEATFRCLAEGGKCWPLRFYRYLPGAALLAEWGYALVARHRIFFSKVSRWLWGKELEPPTFETTRMVFLRGLGVVYGIAFVSLWTQIAGLVGTNGILPMKPYLETARLFLGGERFWSLPTLFWMNQEDVFLHLVCGGGTLLSLVLIAGIAPVPVLVLLWFSYLSLAVVSRDFLQFQWDALLLECGFLAIFLAPFGWLPRSFHRSPPSRAVLWLFAWLLFRLMFSSGMVKLASHDPTWRNLTALQYHYETQPLPTWIGWAVHQLPAWFQKGSAAGMFAIELGVPFLIFMPRRIRYFGCAVLIGFQILIAATGNYCFFNLITVLLCLLLLEDSFWRRWLRRGTPFLEKSESFRSRHWPRWILVPLFALIILATLAPMVDLFHPRFRWPNAVIALYRDLIPFRSINSYGLFAVMTTDRPEIIVEGSNDGENWVPYAFKYKPGDLKRRPGFVAPHQPRLDWQMWFAALGPYQQSPWFLHFCERLLEGSPEVLALLETNPFPDAPPRYLRAVLYDYRFTHFGIWREKGHWWQRTPRGFYLPPITLRDSEFP